MLAVGRNIKAAGRRYVVEALSRGRYAVLYDLARQRLVLVRPDHIKKKGPKGELSKQIFGRGAIYAGMYLAGLESPTGSKEQAALGISPKARPHGGGVVMAARSGVGKSASMDAFLAEYQWARQLHRYMMKSYFERNPFATSGRIAKTGHLHLIDSTGSDASLHRERAGHETVARARPHPSYIDEAGVKLLATLFGLRTLNLVLGPIRIHHRPSSSGEGHMSTTVLDRATLQVLWRHSGDCRGAE